MKTEEFGDSIFYRIACCGSEDHDMTLELEWDKDVKMVFLNFYKKLVWSAYWGTDNWFKSQWLKLKAIYKIVFFGYIEVEESLIIKDPEHIDNFLTALVHGRQKLEDKYLTTRFEGEKEKLSQPIIK